MDISKFDTFARLLASDGWLQKGEQVIGMYYDLDAAILKVLDLTDEQVMIHYGADGALEADITLDVAAETMQEVEALFYAIWSQLSFAYSFIQRNVTNTAITYTFITGTATSGYYGRVTFRGDNIEQLLRATQHHEAVPATAS
ncbi:MAG: hypothetical protein HC893_05295 [Chloroflexaceae bacterium]|nr:hypothetical protein [Chloroflexaceae bacterium]NJL33366.1 hypothetical protein [Chloroflexaceae bacterium]NJO07418.1 hypothetical protein [Chloroflexaceae bacterium]